MAEKRINSRIIHKHDTEAKWNLADFVPSQGEVIIYDIDETFNYERIKIGDGTTSVSNLPFVSVDVDSEFSELSENPVQNKVVAKAVKDLNKSVTDIIGQIGDKSVTEYINDAVNDIQIGGRNLLLNTETPLQGVLNGETSYNVGSYNIVDGGASIAGEIVSLSFDWEYDGNAPAGMFYVLSGAPDQQTLIEAQTISSDSTSGHSAKKAITFNVGATCACVDVVADGVVGTLTISNMKLERGNQITDWTPAVEDMSVMSEQNGYGIIRKEGTFVQENCVENMGIAVSTNIEPKQEGSGEPYPAGGGKNLLSGIIMGAARMSKDGTLNNNQPNYTTTLQFPVEAGKTYVDSTDNNTAANRKTFHYWDANGVWLGCLFGNQGNTINNRPDGAVMAAITYYNPDATQIAKWAQVEEGTTATAYEPYSNIRPIVGYDAISITRSGKNLLNLEYKSSIPSINTGYDINTSGWASNYINIGNNIITLSRNDTTATTEMYLFLYDENKNYIGYIGNAKAGASLCSNKMTGYENAKYCRVRMSDGSNSNIRLQLEAGETATAYEPYKGETFTLSLGNTYYGGSIDWNRGELTVNTACYIATGADNELWEKIDASSAEGLDYYFTNIAPANTINAAKAAQQCSHYQHGYIVSNNNTQNRFRIYTPSGWPYERFCIRPDIAAYPTVGSWKAYLKEQYEAGTPVQVVYELVEPFTVKVDPQCITTLNGVNTVYSHDGSVVVDFNRDVYVSTVKPEDIPSIEGLATEDFVNSEFTRLVGDTEVSIQISEAMSNKAEASDLNSHTSNTNNPHEVTKEQIGLGNVENKSSETIRGELTKDDVTTALGYTPPEESIVYSAATQSADGLMSAADKKTLDELHGHVGDTDVSVQITEGIKGKQDTITGAATSIVSSNLTQSMALVSNANGKVAASSIVTSTELEYLDGATSNIQKQLDNKAASSTLTSHTGNSNIHITSTERSNWNAAQANQNAFSNVKVGTTTIAADKTTDTLTLVAGTNITLTPDATSDSITISASGSGSESSYEHPTHTAYSSGLYKITTNNLGHVTSATKASKSDITSLGVPSSDTNDYPTTWTWTGGTSSGPTASLSGTTGMTAVSVGAIPAASATASGIVTKGAQTFGGVKTFADNVNIGGSASTAYLNFNTSSSTAYSALEANTSGQLNLTSYYSSSYRGSLTILNPKSTGYSQYQGLMYQTNNNGTWDFNMVYHEGSLIASTTRPSNPVKGMIWLELSE